ncbi:MAG: class I SAM-dependent methyltransferase [Planctomycetota bacterium]
MTDDPLADARAGAAKAPLDPASTPEWLQELGDIRDFFDASAKVYDGVFEKSSHAQVHRRVADLIDATPRPINVLVLGCGTGLELPGILDRAPAARITCQDLCPKMLAEVRRKFADRLDQFDFIEGSYLDLDLPAESFDIAVATLTLHHLPPASKSRVLTSVHQALRRGGRFLLGDQVASRAHADRVAGWYENHIASLPGGAEGAWNFDVTLDATTEIALMRSAGFDAVECVWTDLADGEDEGLAVYMARR